VAYWITVVADRLKDAEPALPEDLTDRQQDGIEPLLAVAGEAGGEWPKAIRHAAAEIFHSQAADDQNIGVQLLADLRAIFNDQEKIFTTDLLGKLKEIETSPWADWGKGKGLTAFALSRLLKPFEITRRSIRLGEATGKGYDSECFADAFSRYLAPCDAPPRLQKVTRSQPPSLLAESDFSKGHTNPLVTFPKSASNSHEHSIVTSVTFQKSPSEGGDMKGWIEKTLPSCPACGGFALYREQDGTVSCQSCEKVVPVQSFAKEEQP
jgi:uncharacterized protein DUF3631